MARCVGFFAFAALFPRRIPHAPGVVHLELAAVVLEEFLNAGGDVGFVDGEDDDLVIGEELELDGLGKGDDVELLAELRLVVHVVEDGVVLCGSGLGHVAIDPRGGGHVEALGGADEGVVVDFDEVAFVVALETGSGGAVRFVADDEIEGRQAVEVLGAADDVERMIGGEDDAHVVGVVALGHFQREALGVGGGDDVAEGEGLLAGGGEEAVDVGFFHRVVLGVALALDGVIFAGAASFGDEVDAGVLG